MLSEAASKRMQSWLEFKEEIVRPSWDETWMEQAAVIAKRSHDAQTKVGAVLVSTDNVLISEGYNGFPRGIDDSQLPNLRPAKYLFFSALHAELNALLNAARTGRSTKGSIAYITGPPCFDCAWALWQSGVVEIVCGCQPINMLANVDYKINMEIFRHLTMGQLLFREYHVDTSTMPSV